MNIQDILVLIDKVSASQLSEFKLEEAGVKLKLKVDRGQQVVSELQSVVAQPKVEVIREEVVVEKKAMPVITVPTTEEDRKKAETKVNGTEVKSPLVGTFYAAPAEDKPPYVKVGDVVKKGQVIGIVEAMKCMNEVETEVDGTVLEILVSNEQMVEFGQPLVVIG